MKKTWLIGALSLGTAGIVAAVSFLAANADTTPLAVTCAGVPSGNTIAWTASPSGGNTPYSYLWSGSEIAGNTSSSVTGTYNATGTFDAMIQVMDASSTTATSSCSATITSLATSTPPTPTSTLPSAGLSISKMIDNANPATGTDVNYTLTVSALGPSTSTAAMATDMLPTGVTFENATASMGSYATSTGTWAIGNMSPDSTATLMIEAMVNSTDTGGQVITNSATVGEDPSVMNTSTQTSSAATLTVQNATSTGSGGGGGTPTSTTPLAATCDFSVGSSPNIITYTVTPTGGTSPYQVVWTGLDIPTSSTGSTITVNYPAMTRTVFATANVTDASHNATTADCSVSLGTPTPNPTTNQSLSIGPRGAFDGKHMMVTSTGDDGTFQATIWGVTYTIDWSNARPAIAVGASVNVTGKVTAAAPMVVTANSVHLAP